MRVTVCGIIAAPYIIVIVQRRAQVGLKAPRADGGVVRLDVLHVAVRSCDLKVCASIRVHAGERLPLHPLRCEYPVGRHIDGPAVALVAVERSHLPDRAAGPVRIGQRNSVQIARIVGLVKRKVVGAPIVECLAVVRPAGIVYVVLYHPPCSGVQNAIAVRVRKHNEHIVLPVVVPAIAYAVPISLICQRKAFLVRKAHRVIVAPQLGSAVQLRENAVQHGSALQLGRPHVAHRGDSRAAGRLREQGNAVLADRVGAVEGIVLHRGPDVRVLRFRICAALPCDQQRGSGHGRDGERREPQPAPFLSAEHIRKPALEPLRRAAEARCHRHRRDLRLHRREQRFAVGGSFRVRHALGRPAVAGKLHILVRLPQHPIDERVEPVDGVRRRQHELIGKVVPLEMAELVAQDKAQRGGLVVLVRQKQNGMKKSGHHRRSHRLAEKEPRLLHAQSGTFVREQPCVVLPCRLPLPAAHEAAESPVFYDL